MKKGIIAAVIVLILQLALVPVYAKDFQRDTMHLANAKYEGDTSVITVDIVGSNMSEDYFDEAVLAIYEDIDTIYLFYNSPLLVVASGNVKFCKIAENYIVIYMEKK